MSVFEEAQDDKMICSEMVTPSPFLTEPSHREAHSEMSHWLKNIFK